MAYAVCVVLCTSLAVQSPHVRADNVLTRLEAPVMIRARQQPVDEFLREMLGEAGLPVRVDVSVRGPVNGDFDKPISDVLEDVRRAFNLVYYYDGAVLHVYPAGVLERRVLYKPASIADKVLEHVRTLLLPDASNRIEQVPMGLVVSGTPRFLEQVQEILDAVVSEAASAPVAETYRIFNLKYGWASDVTLRLGVETVIVPGVASVLIDLVGQGVGAGSDSGASTSALRRTPASPTVPKLKGQGLQAASLDAGSEGEQAADPVATSVTTRSSNGSGRVRIVADPLNNAVVVRDRADRMDTYERLIRSLDVEPLMVEIEATIIDIDVERLRQLGIDWRLDYGATNTIVEGSIGGSPLGDGDLVSLVLGDRLEFLSRIRALERQDAARIVSKPHVITLANVEAVLDSISTFYVRIAGREEVDLFPVSVGTTLRVMPHVLQDTGGTRIKLLVGIEDGRLSDERVDQIPVVRNSTINTQALVNEGQSLLVGGLIRDSDQNIASKVPILGDLPGVGGLFRGSEKSSRRTERLFLISPRLTVQARAGGADGYRLDAPILYGEEADIVRSSPIRLQGTRAAFAERDARFPIVPALPASTTSADLARDDRGTGSVPAFRNDPIRLQDDVSVSRSTLRARDAELARVPIRGWPTDPIETDTTANAVVPADSRPVRVKNAPVRLQ